MYHGWDVLSFSSPLSRVQLMVCAGFDAIIGAGEAGEGNMDSKTPEGTRARSLNIKALLAESLGGIAVGLLMSRLGGLLGAVLGSNSSNIFSFLIGTIIGIFVGYVIGVAIGVAVAGRLLRQRGSFWLALLGSILGGALVALLAEPLRLNSSTNLLSYSFFFGALALALVSYNLRQARRD
jgi:hypothetical protein